MELPKKMKKKKQKLKKSSSCNVATCNTRGRNHESHLKSESSFGQVKANTERGDQRAAAACFLEPAGGFHYLTVAVNSIVGATSAAAAVAAKLLGYNICINYLPFTI